MKPAHKCPDWDYLLIKPGDPEMHCCWCTFPKGAFDIVTDLSESVRQLFGDLNVKPLYKPTKDNINGQEDTQSHPQDEEGRKGHRKG